MKYTETRVKKILESLKLDDVSRVDAVNRGGISYVTFMEWQRDYPDFKKRVEEVYEEVYQQNHQIALKCVKNKMKDNPKVAQWFLERTDPEHFGRSERIDQDVNITGVDITYVKPKKNDE